MEENLVPDYNPGIKVYRTERTAAVTSIIRPETLVVVQVCWGQRGRKSAVRGKVSAREP